MKKNTLYAIVFVSFLAGFFTHPFNELSTVFLMLGSSLILMVYQRKMKLSLDSTQKTEINERTQYWDNIYFYLLSLNFTSADKELRVWGANIQNTNDFENFVRTAEQVALKSGTQLKIIVTDNDPERLEKLTASPLAGKVRLAPVNISDSEWPFKGKFDIVYIDKIKNIDVAKKSFHKRLDQCLYHNSALIVNPSVHEFFFKKSWTQTGQGVLTKNHDLASLSNSTSSDLGNDVRSNFI